jgi:hypothetical protein
MDWDDFLVAVLFFVLAAIISIGALETDRVVRRRVRNAGVERRWFQQWRLFYRRPDSLGEGTAPPAL